MKLNFMPRIALIKLAFILIFFISGCSTIKNITDSLPIKKSKKTQETIAIKETKTPEPIQVSPTPTLQPPKPSVSSDSVKQDPQHAQALIPVMREFRAAWIASVANIDWPSKPGLSAYEQKAEAIELLDFLKNNHFNAVILQVRPQADALYQSDLEPWSYFLTGEQGVAPEPYYDPLSFWIEESHKRGLELHAWLNPYRAHHVNGKTVSDKSIVKKNPESVYHLQEGYWWMDPSLKSTQDKTSAVVMDIVKRYDVDGIHFDDYFYPYPSYNGGKDFPDEKNWNAYVNNGGELSRSDWRRDAVNTLIERLYIEIKAEKNWVKFGLSPFGIYRPGSPSTVTGFDQYEKLYADAKLWLNKGWIDYMAPQLYWPINKVGQKFPDLLEWWESENTMQRHLWPGINVVNKNPTIASNQEVLNEITLTRDIIPNSVGTIHWNLSSLTKNPRLANELLDGPYKTTALVPASPWLDSIPPPAPVVSIVQLNSEINLEWKSNDHDIFNWVVYYQYDEKWDYTILSVGEKKFQLKQKNTDSFGKQQILKNIIVTAIDRAGNESRQYIIPIG